MKKFKDYLSSLGLSFYQELIILLTINIILIGSLVMMIIFKVTQFIILMYIVCIPICDYMYISRYKTIARNLKQKHNDEFISLLSYFEIFISNHNNVYKSLNMLIPYSSDWMSSRLETLLSEIDIDKSVAPYIKFSRNFSILVIENVMISIYQMIEQGEDENSLNQFDYVFSSLRNAMYENRIKNHGKSIDMLNSFPLIGAGLITITLTLSIISILGELTNVI